MRSAAEGISLQGLLRESYANRGRHGRAGAAYSWTRMPGPVRIATVRSSLFSHEKGTLTIAGIEFDVRLSAVIFYAALAPMIYWYHPTWALIAPWWSERFPDALGRSIVEMAHVQFVLFFAIPMALIIGGFRQSPVRDYGLCLGNWREGLVWTAALALPIVALLWIVVPGTELQTLYRAVYYGKSPDAITWKDHARMAYAAILQLWAWEYLLRGFLLFGMARRLGPGPAIFLQMVPFALLHVTKPEPEGLSTLFTGILFGIIAWRTRSFLYVFLIHCVILITANLISTRS